MVITISFAAEVYADKKILDTETPFILQAMGTASLLGDLGASLSLVISGLLAPAVTDKLLNLKDIKERFGLRVAQLLSAIQRTKRFLGFYASWNTSMISLKLMIKKFSFWLWP